MLEKILIAGFIVSLIVVVGKRWIAPAVRDLDFMLRRGWGDE
jgi:hypothetical protein